MIGQSKLDDDADTQTLVDHLRRTGVEPPSVEVKEAGTKCPTSLRETLSAFANQGGGTIILGLTDSDFRSVDIDPGALVDALAGMAANDMTPPVRGDIEVHLIDGGRPVVRMDVEELSAAQKPCFITNRGRYGGSYIRGGDGDRRLSDYEIDRLLENRTQPKFDLEPVADATINDLDTELLDPFIARTVKARPRAFAGLGSDEVLRKLGVGTLVSGKLRPTLAALLTFGSFPQEFFPQVNITVVAVPGTAMGALGPSGERFLDNVTCDGPVPEMVADAIAAVTRNMTRAAVIVGLGRQDRYEYPIQVVRELIVNAVMHRDYSPQSRGTQIQVELYADRLVVRSPGGFYGTVNPLMFGEPDVSSSRNALLARFLADTPLRYGEMLAESRGSGIPTILKLLHQAGMVPPTFNADPRRVEVTVPHHAMLTPETQSWIESLGEPTLSQHQIQALAVLRAGQTLRNQTLQGWGVHPADATRELIDLVRRGLVVKIGDRRGATYELAETRPQPDTRGLNSRQEELLRMMNDGRNRTASEVAGRFEVSLSTALNDLNRLMKAGLIEATAPARSKKRAYRRIERAT